VPGKPVAMPAAGGEQPRGGDPLGGSNQNIYFNDTSYNI
jgi:hypothetical protein